VLNCIWIQLIYPLSSGFKLVWGYTHILLYFEAIHEEDDDDDEIERKKINKYWIAAKSN
jgi:hypothetical protein